MTPAFSGGPDGASSADYSSADGAERFTVGVGEDEPDLALEHDHAYTDVTGTEEVTVDGEDAVVTTGWRDVGCEDGLSVCGRVRFADLAWERSDDRWVTLRGEGRYATADALLGVAASLVDRPQPATLQVGLAPAGWSIEVFKDGRILVLANDADPETTLSVHVPLPGDVVPADQLPAGLTGPVGRVVPVTVHGLPASLVRIDAGGRDTGWYLQAEFTDGTTFVVQAPDTFTDQQVVQFAE